MEGDAHSPIAAAMTRERPCRRFCALTSFLKSYQEGPESGA